MKENAIRGLGYSYADEMVRAARISPFSTPSLKIRKNASKKMRGTLNFAIKGTQQKTRIECAVSCGILSWSMDQRPENPMPDTPSDPKKYMGALGIL